MNFQFPDKFNRASGSWQLYEGLECLDISKFCNKLVAWLRTNHLTHLGFTFFVSKIRMLNYTNSKFLIYIYIYIYIYNILIFLFWLLTRTSLVAQTVKRLPTMWKTWVQSLGREDLLEKEMATHSSILAWRIPWILPRRRSLAGYSPWGRKESDMTEWLHFYFQATFS